MLELGAELDLAEALDSTLQLGVQDPRSPEPRSSGSRKRGTRRSRGGRSGVRGAQGEPELGSMAPKGARTGVYSAKGSQDRCTWRQGCQDRGPRRQGEPGGGATWRPKGTPQDQRTQASCEFLSNDSIMKTDKIPLRSNKYLYYKGNLNF